MVDEEFNSLVRLVPIGTQVVSRQEVKGRPNGDGRAIHPAGVVGVVVSAPTDGLHAYRVRFPDGYEAALRREQFVTLREFQAAGLTGYPVVGDGANAIDLMRFVIYRCVIGSRAYGLEGEGSDTDRRGVYLPPAEMHWSLYGVPEQLENVEAQECFWEIQKFLTLGLKANPNVLECLYSPLADVATPLGEELVAMRGSLLSKLVYQTYNGYVLSQFKKLQGDLRNKGEVKWKHVMHLVRLLLAGIGTLRDGAVPVRVVEHRETLLAIKRGEWTWEAVDAWRIRLHAEFDAAAVNTRLPDRPDYEQVNAFLVRARRAMVR